MELMILYPAGTTDFTTLGAGVLTDVQEVCIKEVLNGGHTLTFSIGRDSALYPQMVYDAYIKAEGQLFRIRSVEEGRGGDGAPFAHISCVHVWYEAADCKYIPHLCTPSGEIEVDGWIGQTPEEMLRQAFDGTQFVVGDVEITKPTDLFGTKTNPAAVMNQLIEQVGGERECDNYTLHLRKKRGSRTERVIRYGRDTQSITRSVDDAALITRLYPYGQDDLDISSVNGGKPYLDSPLQGNYSYIRCGSMDFPEVTDPKELYEKGLEQWSNAESEGIDLPRVSYRLGAGELSGVKMGDTVRVTDQVLGADVTARVVEMEVYPFEPVRDKITLSNFSLPPRSIAERVAQQAAQVNRMTDRSGCVMSQYLDNVRGKMVSEVGEHTARRLTVHQLGDIWVDNPDNPTRAMVISDGIFAVADSKKENGDWDWRTVGTAEGLIADALHADWINAGFINTDKITVQSTDGTAKLTGSEFLITTPDGFEARMSGERGFEYIYSYKDGVPYDYVQIDHRGTRRYWHGARIPEVYQFAKGETVCYMTNDGLMTYGVIYLPGAAWKEIAKKYNQLMDDDSRSEEERRTLSEKMIQAVAIPQRFVGASASYNMVVVANQLVRRSIGEERVIDLLETDATGTVYKVNNDGDTGTVYYDGALLRYSGYGGYRVGEVATVNHCGIYAAYDIAVTMDVE
ncbi:MAG: hypothetical protein E7409_02550 [Ruminococcaceae bacterium]|nr:hypothetical protein [Oscillospiraceae bacterium]